MTLKREAEEAIVAFSTGRDKKLLLIGLEKLTKGYYPNTKDLRR